MSWPFFREALRESSRLKSCISTWPIKASPGCENPFPSVYIDHYHWYHQPIDLSWWTLNTLRFIRLHGCDSWARVWRGTPCTRTETKYQVQPESSSTDHTYLHLYLLIIEAIWDHIYHIYKKRTSMSILWCLHPQNSMPSQVLLAICALFFWNAFFSLTHF